MIPGWAPKGDVTGAMLGVFFLGGGLETTGTSFQLPTSESLGGARDEGVPVRGGPPTAVGGGPYAWAGALN